MNYLTKFWVCSDIYNIPIIIYRVPLHYYVKLLKLHQTEVHLIWSRQNTQA